MANERLYTDEEVAEVLSRALQPLASPVLPARSGSGISLAELEAAASEAGIDPARVRTAALTLGESPSFEEGSVIFGPRTTHVLDRVIEGEVPRERLSDLVGIIRRQIRVKGKVEEVGDWLEWTSDGQTIHITVNPERGQTKIQFIGVAGPRLVGSYGLAALASLILLVSLGGAGSLTPGLAAAIVTGGFAAGRALWGFAGRKAGKKYRRMVDDLTSEMARLAEPTVLAVESELLGPEETGDRR